MELCKNYLTTTANPLLQYAVTQHSVRSTQEIKFLNQMFAEIRSYEQSSGKTFRQFTDPYSIGQYWLPTSGPEFTWASTSTTSTTPSVLLGEVRQLAVIVQDYYNAYQYTRELIGCEFA